MYPMAIIAVAYSFWAHNKLQTIYQINRSREVKIAENPAFEQNYLKIREEVLNNVILERFKVGVWEKKVDEWDFICHRWVRNPLPYVVKTKNIVKFYSHDGTMMKWEIFYADKPLNTDYPRESTKLITLPVSIAELVDCDQTELMFRQSVP